MNYAYVTSTSNLVEHSGRAWGNFNMRLYYVPPNATNKATGMPDFNGGGFLDLRSEIQGYDILYLHGWLLWQAWGILGLF